MNRTILFLLLAIFIFSCKDPSESIEPEKNACKVLTYSYTDQAGKVIANDVYVYNRYGQLTDIKGMSFSDRNVYDSRGLLMSSGHYLNVNNHKSSETKYTYNVAKQLIKKISTITQSNQDVVWEHEEYEYHYNGKLKKLIRLDPTNNSVASVENYNIKGLFVLYDSAIGDKALSEYNPDGKVTRAVGYDASDKTTIEGIYEYDQKNRLVKYVFKINGVIFENYTYEYDASDRLIAQLRFANEFLISKIVTQYIGENIKTTRYSDSAGIYEINYELQEIKDGLLKMRGTYEKGILKAYETYSYDSHRNLIRRAVFPTVNSRLKTEEWSYGCN